MTSPHRIRRQRWELRTANADDAFAARQQLRDAWEPDLLPVFERAFDTAAGGATVRIPRIELRLAVASRAELEELLPGLIEAELAEQLRDVVRPADAAAREAAASADPFSTLVHYLRTGALPWWGSGASLAEGPAVLRRWVREEHSRVVALAAAEGETFCFRLLQLLDDPRDVLPSTVPSVWREAVARLMAPPRIAEPPSRYTRLHVAAALVARALSASPPRALPDPAPLAGPSADARERTAVRALLAAVPGALPEWAPSHTERAPGARAARAPDAHDPMPAESRANAQDPAPAEPRTTKRDRARTETSASADAQTRPAEGAGTREDAAREMAADTRAAAATAEPQAIPVAHAGLVLLHPFIAPLFANLEIAKDRAIAPESLPRAAALLHYLAAGEREPFELEMGLVKVLLGHAPETPLPVSAGLLKPGDAEEADALLASVVGHWKALRGTSVEGLRASFLLRTGLLERADDGWRLRVEPATFDVLLDHLPWGFALARLPWMPRPVHTEWTTR
jgi:hypothetical protein